MENRKDILEKALSLTCGDRDASYGSPSVNYNCIAELMEIYFRYAKDKYDKSHDASIFQVFTKIGRIATGQFKDDNYIDGAAYFGIAYECQKDANARQVKSTDYECPCETCSCGSK